MLRYILKRLGWAVVTLFGVTLLTFAVVYRLPADPAVVLAGQNARPEVVEAIRHRLKLDRPVWEQYAGFAAGLMHGDLGQSYQSESPVATLIARRLPATAELALAGWLAWLLIGTA